MYLSILHLYTRLCNIALFKWSWSYIIEFNLRYSTYYYSNVAVIIIITIIIITIIIIKIKKENGRHHKIA